MANKLSCDKPLSCDNPMRARHSQTGFTLVEILIALAILGLATSVVVLNLPPSNQNVHREAQRFAARLIAASHEAITTGEVIGLDIGNNQYSFLRFRDRGWSKLQGRVFSTWSLDNNINVNANILEAEGLSANNEIISGGGSIIASIASVRDPRRNNGGQDNTQQGDLISSPTIQFHPIGTSTAFSILFADGAQSWLVTHSRAGEVTITSVGDQS